jgi:lysozyme
MRLSPAGAEFIKHEEGFGAKLYVDSSGHTHIGHGHLVHRGLLDSSDPREKPYLRGITREQAHALFVDDVVAAERAIVRLVRVPLTQEQFDALTSFVYNVGKGQFRSSTLLALLNGGGHDSVPRQLGRWIRSAGKVDAGLVKRRANEVLLWSEGLYGREHKPLRRPAQPRVSGERRPADAGEEDKLENLQKSLKSLLQQAASNSIGDPAGMNTNQIIDLVLSNPALALQLFQVAIGTERLRKRLGPKLTAVVEELLSNPTLISALIEALEAVSETPLSEEAPATTPTQPDVAAPKPTPPAPPVGSPAKVASISIEIANNTVFHHAHREIRIGWEGPAPDGSYKIVSLDPRFTSIDDGVQFVLNIGYRDEKGVGIRFHDEFDTPETHWLRRTTRIELWDAMGRKAHIQGLGPDAETAEIMGGGLIADGPQISKEYVRTLGMDPVIKLLPGHEGGVTHDVLRFQVVGPHGVRSHVVTLPLA